MRFDEREPSEIDRFQTGRFVFASERKGYYHGSANDRIAGDSQEEGIQSVEGRDGFIHQPRGAFLLRNRETKPGCAHAVAAVCLL